MPSKRFTIFFWIKSPKRRPHQELGHYHSQSKTRFAKPIILAMPKKLHATKLSVVTPTNEELTEARTHLESLSPQQMHSKKASLRNYLARNPDPKSGALPASEVLLRFHVHVIRCKLTERKMQSSRLLSTKRRILKELHWMAEEQLEITYGTPPLFWNGFGFC